MKFLGEVVYLYPDEVYIIIVMANDNGVRYIDPDNLEFDDNGYIKTRYITTDELDRMGSSHGTVKDLSELFTFVKKKFGSVS